MEGDGGKVQTEKGEKQKKPTAPASGSSHVKGKGELAEKSRERHLQF